MFVHNRFIKMKCLLFFSIIFALQIPVDSSEIKVGFCIMATGKYLTYASNLIESARKFFLKDCKVNYFVFTDGNIEPAEDVKVIYQKRLGWPHDTLMRFEVYYQNKDFFEECDYIFATDADMIFRSEVGHEVLGDLVGTEHPGYRGRRGTYETRRQSTAFVDRNEGDIYFAGGFYGGSKEQFLKLIALTSENIRKDSSGNIVAIWHDESHLNRYFIDHPPTIKLSHAYCYPEEWCNSLYMKLIALNKNHSELRK